MERSEMRSRPRIALRSIRAPILNRARASSLRLARDRAPADIAAAEAVGPMDAVDRRVGARLRGLHARAQPAHVEHAPAIREDAVALGARAGMENLDVLGV